MLECWLRHASHTIGKHQIQLAFHAAEESTSAGGTFKGRQWLAGTRESKLYLMEYLRATAKSTANDLVLFTDLDVLPLRDYIKLAEHFIERERTSPRAPEILFLREPPNHCGMTNWVANTGLILMRNNFRVRSFWFFVLSSTRGSRVYEQDIANLLLTKRLKPKDLDWGLLHEGLATAQLERVTSETVAFHAIGVSGAAKFELLHEAWKRSAQAKNAFACGASRSGNNATVPSEWMRRRKGRLKAAEARFACARAS